MKKKIVSYLALSITGVGLMAGSAMALPIGDITDNQSVKISNGDWGTTSGGEFKIDIGNNNSIDFISFCLETNEYINYNNEYSVHSVSNIALQAGFNTNAGDSIEAATKYLYWKYMTNGLTVDNTWDKDTIANKVQKAIWYLEDEDPQYYGNVDEILSFMTLQGLAKGGSYVVNYNVKVLNLWDGTTHKQSQLIGEPVPEPATMLLFGTGLAGLAGVARRKRK